MPVYESETINRKELEKVRKKNVCAVCGGWLALFWDSKKKLAFVACNDWQRTHHDGIAREASEYEKKGMEALNIESRRNIMEKSIGKEKSLAIRRFEGLTTLTREEAKEILVTIWPKATGPELYKAMSICAQYGLNPLMRHLYMIPFKDKVAGDAKLVCVMGIGANRLIASRKHKYSYIDDTPRIMTEAEEIRRYGEADKTKLRGITKLKDMQTGAEASGYGEWPRNSEPYGTDKGNSKANMVFIRSERQALDKLYPADMPSSEIPVVDENYINGKYRVLSDDAGGTGENEEPEAEQSEGHQESEAKGQASKPEKALAQENPQQPHNADDEILKPETEPEQPPLEPPLDENPPSKEDVAELKKWREKAAATMSDMGNMMANDLKWIVPKTVYGLKKWQVIKLIDIYKKAVGG